MLDTGLIVQYLRSHGHTVGSVISVPENAGDYEFVVDGTTISLADVRRIMEDDENKRHRQAFTA